jgi:hypothetical protein
MPRRDELFFHETAMSDLDVSVHLQRRWDGDRPSRGRAPAVRDVRKGVPLGRGRLAYQIQFIWIYYIILFLTVLNFFLTKDPYAAVHNPYGFGDDVFFVNSTRIVGFALVMYFILFHYMLVDWRIIILCALCIISGVVTWRIETKFFTYVLLVMSLLGTSSMGRHDGLLNSDRSGIVRYLSRISLLVWLLGVATVILLPETAGTLYLAVSRDSRSEITLWHMAGLYAVFPCLCVVNVLKNPKYSKLLWIIAGTAHLLLAFVTARRMWLMQTTIPIVLGVAFSRRSLRKLTAIVAMGGGCLAGFYWGMFDKVIEIFFLATSGSQISFEDASNGRASLWEYHLECFLRSPIWGNGAYVIDYNRDKENLSFLKGESEIGVMSVYSEYGALFGLALTAISLVAFFHAVKIIKATLASKGDAFICFLALFYVTNYGLFLVETNSVVYSLDSFVFWYAMMFFFYKKRLDFARC